MKDEAHAIVSDIVRVARDLGLTDAPSRDQYLEHGNYSKYKLTNHFGSYTQALHAAGLTPQPRSPTAGQKAFDRELAKFDTHTESLLDKHKNEVEGRHRKYEKVHKDQFTILCWSDQHGPYCHPLVKEVYFDTAKRLQPDVLIFGGDTADFYELSSHSKNPRRIHDLQGEIDYCRKEFFEPARKLCPNAQIDYILGNHEMRLFKFLANRAPELASLRCLDFANLFELDQLNVNMVFKPQLLNPKNKDKFNYKIYGDKAFMFTHGTATNRYPSSTELQKHGISGASGHVHKTQLFTFSDLISSRWWVTLGMSAAHSVGEEYVNTITSWNMSILLVHVYKNEALFEIIPVRHNWAASAGKYYFRS